LSGAIRWKQLWKDAGQKSPEGAVETYFWAAANNNGERMRQVLAYDHRTNDYAVSQIYADREVRSESDTAKYNASGGVRFVKVRQDGNSDWDHATVMFAAMRASLAAVGSAVVDPLNPPEWEPNFNRSFDLVRLNGEWRIVADEGMVKVTLDDPDSAAVANLLMKMPPEQVEAIRSRVPPETLRIYEDLRSNGVPQQSPNPPRQFTPK
jgi:hypothetical protein